MSVKNSNLNIAQDSSFSKRTSVQRQKDQVLFPEVLWMRPERRDQMRENLIVGGASGRLLQIKSIYEEAISYGAGDINVMIPASVASSYKMGFNPRLITGKSDFNYGCVLLLDVPRVMESEVIWGMGHQADTIFVVTGKSLYLLEDEPDLLKSKNIVLVCGFAEFQRLVGSYSDSGVLISNLPLTRKAEVMAGISKKFGAVFYVVDADFELVISGGRVVQNFMGLDVGLDIKMARLMAWAGWVGGDKLFEGVVISGVGYTV